MQLLDRLSTIVGVVFLTIAAALFLRPGGLLRVEMESRRTDRERARLVEHEWKDIGDATTRLGATTASPSLVEFIDYRCNFCRMFHATETAILTDYEEVAIAIRHLPNPASPGSRAAAAASICASEQDRFPAMHDHLMSDVQWKESDDWMEHATVAGVPDLEAFENCLTSSATADVLARDSAWAARLSIRGTPVLVSPMGGVYFGAAPEGIVVSWIR